MSLLKDFAHLQIPLQDILSATNNFSDENLIREGGFGSIYKGQILLSGKTIDIVARRLNSKYGQGNKEFLTEISMLSNLKHPNLVSFIGFCDENDEKIIINKYEVNSSLDIYLNQHTLTWAQRLQICVGVARALSYIYYDKQREFSIIHRNIKSSKILLDDKWKPKLSGYELSVKNPAARRQRLVVTEVSGTYGYVDPACAKTGGVTHKSDIYSLGVVLFEVLCGRRAFVPENEEHLRMFTMKRLEQFSIPKDGLLSELAKSHYEERKLDDIIDPYIRKQMGYQSYKIFSETAYYCLNEQRKQRPDIDRVVRKLERAWSLQNKHDHILQKGTVVVAEVKEDTTIGHSKCPPNLSYSFYNAPPSVTCMDYHAPPSVRCLDYGAYPPNYSSKALRATLNSTCMDYEARDIRYTGYENDKGPSYTRFTDTQLPGHTYTSYPGVTYNSIPGETYNGYPAATYYRGYAREVSQMGNLAPESINNMDYQPQSLRGPPIFPFSLIRPWSTIARYTFLCRNPPAVEQPPFVAGNPPTNQANGNIMHCSLHEFRSLRIQLEDILLATGNFADENILIHGGYGKLYKGKLKRQNQMIDIDIDIVARRLESIYGQGEIELWTEVSILSSHEHPNLVPIVGFCDERGEKIIIYKYEHSGHGCLHQHLRDQTLTCTQKLQICLGVASALNYIHCDVVHCDISSSNILIDKDWEAKLFGFGLSTKYPGNWQHRLLFSHHFETSANIDPVYTKTLISVTPKYDVYAFGVFLFDVLCGKKPVTTGYGVTEKLDDMFDGDLRKPDTQSLTILLKTAYDCLNQECVQRPSMDRIVEELKNTLERHRKPENLDHPTPDDEATTFSNLTKEKTERLKIPLSDIKSATHNFDDTFKIGAGGYGTVFKAELDHLDIENISLVDWKNKKEILPKKHGIVAIKRIKEEGREGFRAEIETLASCTHPNILSLLGFCNEEREMILVVEFASKGSLDDCLKKRTMANVTWAKRIQICLDVACGLKYLHDNLEGKKEILHRDVKSANILLDDKWNAKVADFGLSKFNLLKSGFVTKHIVGTQYYVDPEYDSTGKYAKSSDIYSFGVVLFEILSGKLAYDMGNDEGLAVVARRRYIQRTIKELIDPNMMEEDNEHIFTVNKGPNQKSLEVFTEIAYQCLSETQKERPEMEAIIKKLEDALHFQGKTIVLMKFRRSDIVSATKKFSARYCIGVSTHGMMYNAKLNHYDRKSLSQKEGKSGGELPMTCNVVALKRIFNREDGHGKQGFLTEIDLLASFKHPNIVSLLGVSSENREMILIYEDAFKGSLHDCLRDTHKMTKLTWAKRLQISLDIALGLKYLQTNTKDPQRTMQFNINSANILLSAEWRAKIACFWLSTLHPANKEANIYNSNNIVAREVQSDPEYIKIEKLKKESGVYSFGVILLEILCGKVQYDKVYYAENEKGLPTIARRCYSERTMLKKMIDPILKEKVNENSFRLDEEVSQDSFDIFSKIAYGCCALTEVDRPSMEVIINELEDALNKQVEHMEHLKTQVVKEMKYFEHLKVPLNDIKLATQDFSRQYKIGSGGSSTIYKADLGYFDEIVIDGKNKSDQPKRHNTVAIKRFHSREGIQGEEMFIGEIETLSNCNHPNIVSLLGFCYEDDEMILILEYASNRSLDDFLGNLDNMTNLTWAQRLQICLDIAQGIHYLHMGTHDKQPIIHRDIKSANILLKDNWVAQIADFGLCKLTHAYGERSTLHTHNIAGTPVYVDPEYKNTGKLKKESDIYSFGVVLFEIMCGKLAYDKTFNEGGLATIARKCFIEGTIKQIVDPRLMEDDEKMFMINGGLNQDSLDTFSKIAYECVAERQVERPSIKAVVRELEKAYYFQINSMDKIHISLEDIKLMTENFSDRKCTGEGRYWKQYEGEIALDYGCVTVVAKRFDIESTKQHHHFMKEYETLFEYKHKNIIGVAGYCQDMNEKIIVYEHVSNGRLNEHLDDTAVTWMIRLKICTDVACGLNFLHTGGVTKDVPIMHRDIKSACILLDGDWTAKISNLELSLNSWEREEIEYVTDNAYGSLSYMDPEYIQNGYLTQKSDIYSLGVVLLEMLCGRLAWVEGFEDHSYSLVSLAKECFKEGKLDELVFEGIKEQIEPESLATFANIALRCLKEGGGERPEASEVVMQLKKAVEFQEDVDIWEPKLPRDYKEIFHYSEIVKNRKKEDIYHKLIYKGLLLKDRELCLSLGSNGEKHYMISAKKFSYKNRKALKWRHIPQSRFENVAEMLTLSNLKIKIRTLFLSPGVNYGVHLVFKFCGPRTFSAKSTYVNLTYKMGSQTFHAYFATWRDEEWMTIELCRFLNQKEDTYFEVLLEGFSSYYCGKGAIYVEGIEFRVIDNVIKHEEIEKTNEVRQLPSNSEETLRRSENDEANKMILLNEVNGKKQLMLSAREALYYSSNVKHFHLKASAESRFQEVMELLPQQVLRINCKIQSQMLSQDTEYSCYLVFKLSKKCSGLHCPVKVHNLPQRKNKEAKNIYFRSPSQWNLHDTNHIPKQRDDGWTEVNVWNFNSNRKLQNDCFWVNLKFISYEGTMAGLIVCGLEFRPV